MATTNRADEAPVRGLMNSIDTKALLRIHAGAFFIPQIYYKYESFPNVSKFLGMAGFYPPSAWVIFAGVIETVIALCLIFNIFTKHAALLAVAVLAIAGGTVASVRGLSWLFNHGGVEYHVFWALICLYVFINAWQDHPGWLPTRR